MQLQLMIKVAVTRDMGLYIAIVPDMLRVLVSGVINVDIGLNDSTKLYAVDVPLDCCAGPQTISMMGIYNIVRVGRFYICAGKVRNANMHNGCRDNTSVTGV